MIKVQDWIASIPEEEKHVAYVGEGMSEQREFLLCGDGWENYEDWSFHLDMAFDPESITTRDSRQVVQTTVNSVEHKEETGVTKDEVTTKETYTVHDEEVLSYDLTDVAPLDKWVEEEGIRLTWTVLRQHTLLPGKLWATIRAVSADAKRIKKSAMMVFEVEPSVSATPAAMPPVSEFEQMEAQMDALRQKTVEAAEEAAGHAENAADAAANAEQARADAAREAESAMRSSVTAVSAASGSAYAQQLAAESADEAAEHAKQAESHRGYAAAEANTAVEACTEAKEQAQIAAEQAAAAETARQNAAGAVTKASAYAMQAETSAATATEAAAKLTEAVEDVDDLTAAVFEVQEVGECPNLFNPELVAYKKPYDTWGEQYISAKIPAATGDVVYVKLRDESRNEVDGLFNEYYLYGYASNGTKYAIRNDTVHAPACTIDKPDIAYMEIGFRPSVVSKEELADFMVTLNDKPTEFVSYWEGTTKTVNRIENNAKEIALLKEQMEQGDDTTAATEKNWQGKKVLVMGDSISTDYYGNYTKWVTVLKNQGYFPADTLNDSIHATGFVARYNNEPNDFLARVEAVADKDTYDLVVVFGGINDFLSGNGIPMGESGGDKTAEFKAAVDYFFDYLVNNFTQARIVVLSPLRTHRVYPNVTGHKYTDYIDYIKEVAKYYCLPVLNLTEESGFCPHVSAFGNKWTFTGYTGGDGVTGDGVHPNAEYEEKHLAPMIKNFLNNFI